MRHKKAISLVFGVAALYEGVIGVLFFIRPMAVFRWFEVTPPNHVGYVKFPALLLILFTLMFVQIASDPERHRGFIPYGVGLKVSYSGLVFWYWATTGVPSMWKPFAVIDALMVVPFLWAMTCIRSGR